MASPETRSNQRILALDGLIVSDKINCVIINGECFLMRGSSARLLSPNDSVIPLLLQHHVERERYECIDIILDPYLGMHNLLCLVT